MSWRARLSKSLNELRIVYCANSAASNGTREFIKANYKDLKAMNPGLPMYIRPADGVQPYIAARYDRGMYAMKDTTGMSSEQVVSVVEALEAQAAAVNARSGGGGIGSKFKLADIV